MQVQESIIIWTSSKHIQEQTEMNILSIDPKNSASLNGHNSLFTIEFFIFTTADFTHQKWNQKHRQQYEQ